MHWLSKRLVASLLVSIVIPAAASDPPPLLQWFDYATVADETTRKEREAFKQLACGTPTADEVPLPVYPGAVVELAFCHGGPQPCPLRTGVFPKEQLEGACGPPDTGRRFSFLHILTKDHHTKVSAWYQRKLCSDRPTSGNGPCEGWFWVTAGGPQLGMRSHDATRSIVPHLPPIWATRLGFETSIVLLFK
ncbi:MAG: hypothetical protein AAF458_03135 [Pseudomonadota bacterium]